MCARERNTCVWEYGWIGLVLRERIWECERLVWPFRSLVRASSRCILVDVVCQYSSLGLILCGTLCGTVWLCPCKLSNLSTKPNILQFYQHRIHESRQTLMIDLPLATTNTTLRPHSKTTGQKLKIFGAHSWQWMTNCSLWLKFNRVHKDKSKKD